MDFESALQNQLNNDVSLRRSASGKRMARILALPKSNNRRAKVLARMENHAKVQLGKDNPNWGSVSAPDWKSIFELLAKLLPIIMALFGL